jgi:hypothetical protein
MEKIKLLFKIGYAYHKAAFDPVIDLIMNDDKYDVWFSLDMERIRRFFIFDFAYRQPIIDEWKKLPFDICNLKPFEGKPDKYDLADLLIEKL